MAASIDGSEEAAPEAPPQSFAAIKPKRIVSLNLCTDQLLMQLADHRRIAAVSHLARDEAMSAMAKSARALGVTRGTAEEVIALKPDLVIAGAFSTRETAAILRQLGYYVVDFDPASDFPSIKANIAKMALVIGEEARGELAAQQIDEALEQAQLSASTSQPTKRPPIFANIEANGFTSGKGALISAMANAAGFSVLGEQLGIYGTRQISLEQLLVSQPDVLGLSSGSQAPAMASDVFTHPALEVLQSQASSVELPVKYTSCGTLSALEALRLLADARAKVGAR